MYGVVPPLADSDWSVRAADLPAWERGRPDRQRRRGDRDRQRLGLGLLRVPLVGDLDGEVEHVAGRVGRRRAGDLTGRRVDRERARERALRDRPCVAPGPAGGLHELVIGAAGLTAGQRPGGDLERRGRDRNRQCLGLSLLRVAVVRHLDREVRGRAAGVRLRRAGDRSGRRIDAEAVRHRAVRDRPRVWRRPPLTDTDWLYAAPTWPPGSDVVSITSVAGTTSIDSGWLAVGCGWLESVALTVKSAVPDWPLACRRSRRLPC